MAEKSRAEIDQIINAWVEKANKNKGAEKDLSKRLGPYPLDLDDFYGQQMNELVTADAIRHFAAACGDRNPLWWNVDYARKTKWGGVIAPPMFTDWLCAPWTARRVESPSPLEWVLLGLPSGVKREIFQVMRPGDKIKVLEKWLGLVEREVKQEPKRFRLFFNTDQRTYLNQKNETVAVVEGTWVILATYFDPVKANEQLFAGTDRKRHKFSDEERDAIYRGYDTETRRGADTLVWEDVNVGEEIRPVVVGPLNSWDVAAFFVAAPGRAMAFDIEWERIKSDFGFAWFDPRLNVWKPGGEAHLRDDAGPTTQVSGGYAFDLGGHLEWLISRMICNWMGDNGFLRKCQVQFRAAPIQGDAIHTKGKVTSKSVEGNEHLVDLEVSCTNQDGLMIVPGRATVRLPSRSESKSKK